ncbi:MAG: glutathione S-transferase family protein [Myxococcales bacterium]|nr:glutathione S-transferase family protein [Myxococcales bacterium]
MYRNTGKRHDKIILWGAPLSLWTGRMWSYLMKKGVDFQQIYPVNQRYSDEIMPAIGYMAIPVTEFQDGTLIQDGTDTMLYMEERYPEVPMIPTLPLQRAVAWLIEFFGCDSFFIPAMHYRWNYPEQRAYIDAEFARAWSPRRDREGQQADTAELSAWASAFVPYIGVNPQTIPAIEDSHIESLELLNDHFQHHPYILGGHPSVADFGLMAPFYAHLGRDPVPANVMKNKAPHVYRWTERMLEPGIVDGEFFDYPPAFAHDDSIPDTLIPFIEYLFRDCGPQVHGMIETFNAWANDDPKPISGTLVKADPEGTGGAHPNLGEFEFELRGTKIKTQAFANVVFHFQRLLDVVSSLDDAGRAKFEALVSRTGGTELMASKLGRRMKSENYQLFLN